MLCTEASQKEADLLDKKVEDNKKKIEILSQQEQDIIRENKKELKRMQEHEARIRQQETKILKEKEKLQKNQHEAEQETVRQLKIELEEMKGKNIQLSQ